MESLQQFFHMGGYGGFIWPAYILVTVVLAGLLIASRRFVRAAQDELDSMDRPHRQSAPEAADEA
jgi:heme exporter protein D